MDLVVFHFLTTTRGRSRTDSRRQTSCGEELGGMEEQIGACFVVKQCTQMFGGASRWPGGSSPPGPTQVAKEFPASSAICRGAIPGVALGGFGVVWRGRAKLHVSHVSSVAGASGEASRAARTADSSPRCVSATRPPAVRPKRRRRRWARQVELVMARRHCCWGSAWAASEAWQSSSLK